MSTIQGNKGIAVVGGYQLNKLLGEGSFGQVFLGQHVRTGEKAAVKVEKIKYLRDISELQVYQLLQGEEGFPKLFGWGKDFIVMELLGDTLYDVFENCERYFSSNTVAKIGFQLVERVEVLHSKHIIHGDIKPKNLVIGKGSNCNKVYMVDFGLTELFRDPESGNHVQFKIYEGHQGGTLDYMSIPTQKGLETSRRNDMESIGYTLLYFLSRGKLPWRGMVASTLKQRLEKILEIKMSSTPDQLCRGYPVEFAHYLSYSRKIGFYEEPDYPSLKRLFFSVCKKSGAVDAIDWTMRDNLLEEKEGNISETEVEDNDKTSSCTTLQSKHSTKSTASTTQEQDPSSQAHDFNMDINEESESDLKVRGPIYLPKTQIGLYILNNEVAVVFHKETLFVTQILPVNQ